MIWVAVLMVVAGLVLSACQPRNDDEGIPTQAYIIRLEGPITEFWATKVADVIDQAWADGVEYIVIELNTPGGTVLHSMELADHIFEARRRERPEGDDRPEFKILAYVRAQAYSGGTMVALACDEIYMHPSGMIGDVAPVDQTGQIQGEKLQTVIRQNLIRYAAGRYPRALIEAMVTPEIKVFSTKRLDKLDAETTYVTGQEWAAIPEAEKDRYAAPKLIVPEGRLLTMTRKEAVALGFARAVENEDELFDTLGINPVLAERIEITTSEKVIRWLDVISPLLITAGIVLLFVEVSHPGFGLPGVLGISCFVLFFVVKMSIGHAHMLELLLFLIGIALLLMEVFIIPGFGVAGISGILLVFASLVLAIQNIPELESTADLGKVIYALSMATLRVAFSFVAAAVLIGILMRYLPTMPFLKKVIHTESLATASAGELEHSHVPGLQDMVGAEGRAITSLRPAGRAEFDDVLLDVVTTGAFLDRGAPVRILEVHGSRVVVEKAQENI